MRIGSEAWELGPERASGVASGGGFLKGFRSGALVEFFVCDGGLFWWASFVCASDRQRCFLRVASFVCDGGLFLRGYDFFDDYMLKKS